MCIVAAWRKTRVLKTMSLFQGWQLNSRNVNSSLSYTNVHIHVQLIRQVCPWLKAKENREKIPLQEGGSGWKYPWRVTRHETAWEYPISSHSNVQKLKNEADDYLVTPAIGEEKARQGMACFLAMEVAGHRCQKQLCKVCTEPQPLADTRICGQIGQTQFQITLYQLPNESGSHGKVTSAKFPDSPNLCFQCVWHFRWPLAWCQGQHMAERWFLLGKLCKSYWLEKIWWF